MRKWNTIILAVALCGGLITLTACNGCQSSPERTAHTTLSSVGIAVDVAAREYMDGVVAGTIRTNEFPQITAAYQAFNRTFTVAVDMASGNTNALSSSALASQASKLIADIHRAMLPPGKDPKPPKPPQPGVTNTQPLGVK